MDCRVFVALLLAFMSCKPAQSLKIQVVDIAEGNVRNEFTDNSAAFHERSYLLPTKRSDAIKGLVIYPNPRNACSPVDPPPNDTFIAYLGEYTLCPNAAENYLKYAGFGAIIGHSEDNSAYLSRNEYIPQALILDTNFAQYLVDSVIPETNKSSAFEIIMWDNSFAKLEQLFIIFGAILLVAVTLSICVFCASLFCRAALVRWRNRGLSMWQVRALPKRKFRKAKESTDTCSICLEEFKEGETVRVLPCDHVFHPKCVDEWLRKWNRTCPLCKCSIKRAGGRTQHPPALTDDNETSLLQSGEERVSLLDHADGEGCDQRYGTTGVTSALQQGQHRRGGSEASSSSSSTGTGGGASSHGNQVTAAEMERSTGSHQDREGSSSPLLYHTPLHSDQEAAEDTMPSASFKTACSSHNSAATGTEQV